MYHSIAKAATTARASMRMIKAISRPLILPRRGGVGCLSSGCGCSATGLAPHRAGWPNQETKEDGKDDHQHQQDRHYDHAQPRGANPGDRRLAGGLIVLLLLLVHQALLSVADCLDPLQSALVDKGAGVRFHRVRVNRDARFASCHCAASDRPRHLGGDPVIGRLWDDEVGI